MTLLGNRQHCFYFEKNLCIVSIVTTGSINFYIKELSARGTTRSIKAKQSLLRHGQKRSLKCFHPKPG